MTAAKMKKRKAAPARQNGAAPLVPERPPRRIWPWVLLVLALGITIFQLQRATPAQQIHEMVQQAERGVREKNTALLQEVISPDYTDRHWFNRDRVLGFLAERVWAPEVAGFEGRIRELQLRRNCARVLYTAVLDFQAAGAGKVRREYDLAFDVRLERDGWRIVAGQITRQREL